MDKALIMLIQFSIYVRPTTEMVCMHRTRICWDIGIYAKQCSAVQCSAVQCSAVQCSAVQCSAVQCSAVQCSSLSGFQSRPVSGFHWSIGYCTVNAVVYNSRKRPVTSDSLMTVVLFHSKRETASEIPAPNGWKGEERLRAEGWLWLCDLFSSFKTGIAHAITCLKYKLLTSNKRIVLKYTIAV